jgi:plasmid maintenance system antidote protein VapI
MLPRNRIASHPGNILSQEFLEPMHITQTQFAKHIGLSLQTIKRSLKAKEISLLKLHGFFQNHLELVLNFG